MPIRGEDSVESEEFNVLLESWYRPGPECQQTEAQWQKVNTEVNVQLTRLERMITQNRAAEKSKLSVKLFALVIEYVDVFRQLTYPASAHSGGNYRVQSILSFTSTSTAAPIGRIARLGRYPGFQCLCAGRHDCQGEYLCRRLLDRASR